VTRSAHLEEAALPGETPAATVERLALEKARVVAGAEKEALVVGADTAVVVGRELLGKPADEAEARRMLGTLSARPHEVVTGVAVIAVPGGATVSGHARTEVRFRTLEEEDVVALVESEEGLDKAGAYGIQGLASLMVEGITGDYFNVVGLPLGLLRRLIREEATR